MATHRRHPRHRARRGDGPCHRTRTQGDREEGERRVREIPSFSSDVLAAMQRATMPDFARWQRMVYATGGCAQPIRLHGERVTVDAGTGAVLDVYRTADEPTGFLLTACGNRRASRCPSCSATYKDDTYHLIIS